MIEALVVEDVDVLVAAQEKAVRILSDARRQAEAARLEAGSEAAALLLRQQELAERLLQEQKVEATATAERAAPASSDAPPEGTEDTIAQYLSRAEGLLRRQSQAAEALRVTEESDAVKEYDVAERDAISLLLKAHRAAAAVLLHARMIVEERHGARTGTAPA